MTPAIKITNLTVRYGDIQALNDTHLEIMPGTLTALIGMNGAGKSTLFKALIGAVRPTSGKIEILGGDPQSARRLGMIAYLPQTESLDWSFPVSVYDVVMMGRYGHQSPLLRRPRPVDRQIVVEAIERVGLSDFSSRQIGQLSGGQRKRAFLARSIAQGAEVLLLDEPFSGVDTVSESTIRDQLSVLAAQGSTIFVSTHDLQVLPQFAEHAVLLRNRILFHGPIGEALDTKRLARLFAMELPTEDEGA